MPTAFFKIRISLTFSLFSLKNRTTAPIAIESPIRNNWAIVFQFNELNDIKTPKVLSLLMALFMCEAMQVLLLSRKSIIFFDAGGQSRLGTQYIVNIRFEHAPLNITDALEIRWLNRSELNTCASTDGTGEAADDNRMTVGFTQLGSDVVKINPVYADARSIKLTFSNWPIDQRQLRDTIKHTRGVFAHEISHAIGLSHMSNQTKSVASYAFDRSVNGLDAQAICLLVTKRDKVLCPQ